MEGSRDSPVLRYPGGIQVGFGMIPPLKPGQKLIIDNATFHKGGRIEALVKPQVARFGTCRLTHLTSTRLSTVGLG